MYPSSNLDPNTILDHSKVAKDASAACFMNSFLFNIKNA
jgi:hypothetical protein